MEMETGREKLEGRNMAILKLPIGYRFRPTDEELLVHYLSRKVFGLPLPASVIPEFDVFHSHPHSLPGEVKEKRYFFSKTIWNTPNHENKLMIRKSFAAGNNSSSPGYWKTVGRARQILDSETQTVLLGIRTTLSFSRKMCSNGFKTRWIMHQFRLLHTQNTALNSTHPKVGGEWVVCGVFQKRRPLKKRTAGGNYKERSMDQMMMTNLKGGRGYDNYTTTPQSPSSSSSSGITQEVSNCNNGAMDYNDEEEESSSFYLNIRN